MGCSEFGAGLPSVTNIFSKCRHTDLKKVECYLLIQIYD